MTPLKTIRKYCLYCMNEQPKEIVLCPSKNCFFYHCRYGKNNSSPHISALQLIKKYCLDCSGGSLKERKNCWDENCSLYQYRLGHNPALSGKHRKQPVWLKKHHSDNVFSKGQKENG